MISEALKCNSTLYVLDLASDEWNDDKKVKIMKREINNLQNWWDISTKKQKIRKKYLKKQKSDKKIVHRGRPKRIEKLKKNLLSNIEQIEKKYYKYDIEDILYFDFLEILSFLKEFYNFDYENDSLKDEKKEELKSKLNIFFNNFVK